MSANARRGEIEASLDGRDYTLCLTLGALAELENAFSASDLSSLVGRFSGGRLSANDLTKIIGAGLRGAGNDVSDADVGAMRAEGGAAGFASIAARLLAATFGQVQAEMTPPGHPSSTAGHPPRKGEGATGDIAENP
jgi:hypothetical protein